MARFSRYMPGEARKVELRQAQKERESEAYAGGLIASLDPTSVASEAYRTLRTNLLYTYADVPPKVIVLTSPGQEEGKSATCANLGVMLAQAGKSTLILDCDLRKPTIHRFFGLPNVRGVVDSLVGEFSLQEVWQEALLGLKVITVGPLPPNPAELLDSRRFAEFLAQLRTKFDHVLVDTPPIELVSDPAIVAAQGDGVLLVFDAQNTRKGGVQRAVRRLDAVGATVLGTVMNNAKASAWGH